MDAKRIKTKGSPERKIGEKTEKQERGAENENRAKGREPALEGEGSGCANNAPGILSVDPLECSDPMDFSREEPCPRVASDRRRFIT